MSPHPYTEDQLVEQPAIVLFGDLGWQTVSAMTLAGANREIFELLKDGVKVAVPDRERGGMKDERVRVVDWENPAANDFLLVSQMTVTGQLYTCRPDLIGFVNGLPWVVIELKKPGVAARQAFDENLTSYKHPQNGIPQLFWYSAFLIASNGTDSRVGLYKRPLFLQLRHAMLEPTGT